MEELKRNPTDEELNQIQSHLSPKDFDEFLKDLEAMHGLKIYETVTDCHDPHGYSLPDNEE